DLEKFLHSKDIHVPTLIRIGIAHYQFETIHPFLDGNGRIGRLLITLYLVSEKILEKPLLYLSVFFEKDKSLYYDNLTIVRERNGLLQWLKYFLVGIEQTATQAVETLTKVLELKNATEQTITSTMGRRGTSGLLLLNSLFAHPFVTVKNVERVTGLSKKAAGDLVQGFVENNVLEEVTGNTRNRLFVFSPYLDLFE
ncbi:MAG: Fic family protein, partial [Acidobacteriota bacterium]